MENDVDRSGAGAGHAALSDGRAAHRIAGGVADLGAVGRLTEHRLVDQPAGSAARGAFDRRSRTSSCASSPARPGTSSRPSSVPKTTGCRRTTTRSSRWRASRTARRPPTSDSPCWPIWRPTISGTSRPASWSSARPTPFTRWTALERHRGHFYNWYDTQSLKPLLPRLHFHGGQRKPGGPPAYAAPGTAGDGRSTDREPAMAGRTQRHLRHSGGCQQRVRSRRTGWHAGGVEGCRGASARGAAAPYASCWSAWKRRPARVVNGAASVRHAAVGAGPGRAMPGRAGGHCLARARRVEGIPTLREVAALPRTIRRRRCTRRERIAAIEAWPCRRASSRRWSTTSCSIAPVSC